MSARRIARHQPTLHDPPQSYFSEEENGIDDAGGLDENDPCVIDESISHPESIFNLSGLNTQICLMVTFKNANRATVDQGELSHLVKARMKQSPYRFRYSDHETVTLDFSRSIVQKIELKKMIEHQSKHPMRDFMIEIKTADAISLTQGCGILAVEGEHESMRTFSMKSTFPLMLGTQESVTVYKNNDRTTGDRKQIADANLANLAVAEDGKLGYVFKTMKPDHRCHAVISKKSTDTLDMIAFAFASSQFGEACFGEHDKSASFKNWLEDPLYDCDAGANKYIDWDIFENIKREYTRNAKKNKYHHDLSMLQIDLTPVMTDPDEDLQSTCGSIFLSLDLYVPIDQLL